MSNDWWARKLGVAPQQQQPAPPATQPPRAPSPAQQQANQQGIPLRNDAVAPPQTVEEGAARLFDEGSYDNVRRRSVETGNDGRCPNCGGDKYFENIRSDSRSTMGKPSTPRCYECGYPITHGLNAS